jgi:GNAT superfamily N-acetyltransferase
MRLRSLGYRTDLIFPAFDGQVVDHGDYLVVRTPSNPGFYWGNFLLFDRSPQEGDFDRWRALFKNEIGVPPEMHHQAFGWDSPEGDEGVIEPFVQAGFEAKRDVVMTTTEPWPPVRLARAVDLRPLQTESEWAQAADLQVVCREPVFEETAYRQFRQRQMERYRRMSEAGLGDWYGASIDGRLVADLGVFHDKDLGRYQSVETHPDFRRQGIAGSLIYEAGRQAIARYDLHTLVMIAEQGASPARLYESLGFQPIETSVGLLWFPHADASPASAADRPVHQL